MCGDVSFERPLGSGWTIDIDIDGPLTVKLVKRPVIRLVSSMPLRVTSENDKTLVVQQDSAAPVVLVVPPGGLIINVLRAAGLEASYAVYLGVLLFDRRSGGLPKAA